MESNWWLKNKRLRLKKLYRFLKEKRWRTEGHMLFFSILALISYITLAVNIVYLIKTSRMVSGLIALLVMLALLSLFIYLQYRLTWHRREDGYLRATPKYTPRIKQIINKLSKSTILLCVYAVIEMFYLYVTTTQAKSYSQLSIYGLCAFGLILYLAGLMMLRRLSVLRERLMNFRRQL